MLTESEIKLLSTFSSLPSKEATAKEIMELLDYPTVGAVNLEVIRLVKKVAPFFSYVPMKKANGQLKYWPCLFEGRNEKHGFVWTLKKEVEEWYKQNFQIDDFYEKVQHSLKNPEARKKRLKSATGEPKRISTNTTTFERNPDVVADVLENAKGICQKCNSNAPFIRRSDGTPYLEVHHIIPLSLGGLDTVENAIALCPNCHRQLHFG